MPCCGISMVKSNDKDSPNENFAREMFELYSIGRGHQIAEGNYTNYTEDDIKAACRSAYRLAV